MIRRFLFDPYEFGFMARALAEVIIVGAVGAVVGVHVLLRRMAFVTEALQHTVFPGVAIAFAMGQSLLAGAAVAAAVTVVLVVFLTSRLRIDTDAALGVLTASFFALGVVVVSRRSGYATDLTALLFGRILDVDGAQVLQTLVLGSICVAVVALVHKELVLHAFDPVHAEALGYRGTVLDLVLQVVIAVVVVLAVRAVGTVLVVAFVVTPAAAARTVTRSVGGAILAAAVFAGIVGWLGLSASYEASVHHEVPLAAGATVVVAYTVAFVVVAAAAATLRRSRHA